VGEEDTLILKVGGGEIDEGLPDQLQRDVPGITQVLVEQGDEGQITISARRGRKALPDVIQLTEAAGVEVQSVAVQEPDLEAVFLHLTGRALRD